MYPRRMWQVTLLLAGLLCAAAPALAQVTVDLHALDALPGAKAPAPEVRPRRAPPKPASQPSASAKLTKPSPQQPAATPAPESSTAAATPAPAAPQGVPAPTPPAATLPVAPPPVIALAPVAPPPPAAQAPPPPPPPISDTAASAASAVGAGLRVTFGEGETDLSPASAGAIQNLVRTGPQGDGISFNVVAYAAGTPEDPSTARRLSLARALAVRSALIADGVSSTRIYVRALGAQPAGAQGGGAQAGDAPADRVDLSVLGVNAPSIPASAPADAPANPPSRQQ
jgi:outer membrane protein OmpA-like peptidoglycan-associated protein